METMNRVGGAMVDALVADEQASCPVLVLSPSGFPPLLLGTIAEELASHVMSWWGHHTYETAVTVFADGRAVPLNPVAGVLGPQTGPYQERFRQRAAVFDDKAADLASVADQLERLDADGTGLPAGRLDLGRPVLQPLAEHPGFALFGADAVKAGTATDAAAYDTEKAITFDGWRTVHRMWRVTRDVLLAFFATHLRQAAAPPLLTESSGDYPELTYGAP